MYNNSYSSWINFISFALLYWLKHLNEPHILSYNSFVECLPRTCAKLISIFLGPFNLCVSSPYSVFLALINQCILALTHTKTVLHEHWKRPQHYACSTSVFTCCLSTVTQTYPTLIDFSQLDSYTSSTSHHCCVLWVPF